MLMISVRSITEMALFTGTDLKITRTDLYFINYRFYLNFIIIGFEVHGTFCFSYIFLPYFGVIRLASAQGYNTCTLIIYVAGRPCGSVAQRSECSHCMREVLGSSPGWAVCFFLSCDIWWPVWVHALAASSKGTVSSVPAWFQADSGTNLIKQGEIVTGRLCGSVAQWSESSHGMREVLGSSPGQAMCFFPPP